MTPSTVGKEDVKVVMSKRPGVRRGVATCHPVRGDRAYVELFGKRFVRDVHLESARHGVRITVGGEIGSSRSADSGGGVGIGEVSRMNLDPGHRDGAVRIFGEGDLIQNQ